ncbi:hypothetical protein CKY39_07645 [Variovorax boronicumulans]|uniref:Uncharacterized protein n=1 Tax=Variovorax boronicumulans TaxID=436515 RepID=A0A250DFF3_9BURK|nr:hypothetical protein [Variovorax boronicumulans]ATA53105.1 hypothetical protein CKY39_07645 [Variovorax boronicumulans]
MKDEQPDDLPPLTQEETEKWIGEVEDKAWMANAEVFACRFLLGNLLSELNDRGLMDATAFVSRLQAGLTSPPQGLSQQQKFGLEDLLRDLQLHFAHPSDGEAGSGRVFH